MFYSTDLLKRKTPLGAIWLAANGKKLQRGHIMKISIDKTCDQILDPEIPHALRLQAVLASGVCTVFDKQSQYLLDDIQLTLSNVKAASTSLAEARNDPILARPADINMMEEVSINADAFAPAAFPTGFTPHPAGGRSNRLQDQNDDLILMPSIPDSVDDRAKSGQSPRGLIQAADPEYFVMETMDAPVFPEGFPDADFAFPAPGEEGYPADPYIFNDEMNLPLQEENLNVLADAGDVILREEQGKFGHTAQKEGGTIKTRRYRHKKALVDDPNNITMNSSEMEIYIKGGYKEDLLISRPRAIKRERPDLFSLGPATGRWPEELMSVWERCNERCKQPFVLKTPDGEGGKRGGLKRARATMFEDDVFQQQQMQDGGYYQQDGIAPPDQFVEYPMPDEYFPPPEDYNFGFPDGMAGGAEERGALGGGMGEEFETERLRAALYGTPGAGNYKDAMFQLGLTPASDNENLMSGGLNNRGGRGRYSNASRRDSRDSRGGRLSERSSDPGTRRLSDLLEEMQAAEGNLADALPHVGDDGGVGGDGGSGRVSQFNLLEESGPSMSHTQLTGPMEQHSKTFQVLASLRSLVTSLELSLNQATYGLNRMEAAQVFSHVLVGSSKGFIDVNQDEPYGDITITFFN